MQINTVAAVLMFSAFESYASVNSTCAQPPPPLPRATAALIVGNHCTLTLAQS